jgi:hypothetical protein
MSKNEGTRAVPDPTDEPPTDVLAAEEFGVPAPDPNLRQHPAEQDAPVDVLAAEEFGVPAPDPLLRPEHLDLPSDLVGGEPRDVLAAEEFAMPAPNEAHEPPAAARRSRPGPKLVAACLVPVTVMAGVWRRRRRRGKAD